MYTKVSNPIENKPLEGVIGSAAKAKKEEEVQAAKYEAAKLQEAICNELMCKAEYQFKTAQKKYEARRNTGGYIGSLEADYNSAKIAYTDACTTGTSAGSATDIARGSYLDSIFNAAETNNYVAIAEARIRC